MPALAGLSLQNLAAFCPFNMRRYVHGPLEKLELVVGLDCDLLWKRESSSGCPCQVLTLDGLRSTWSTCEIFVGGICGGVVAVLPTHKGLDLDLGQILLMHLVPGSACHPLAVDEGGEDCMADKMTPWCDAGALSTSTSWGTWDGKKVGSPVPLLLEGLA